MADSITTTVLSACATVNSKISNLPLKDGQLIFIQDKQTIALDFGGKRKFYKQIEELATEEARTSMLAPVADLYYFVVETAVLWTYRDGWVQITTSPKDINAIEKSAKDYADEVSNLMTGTLDENGDIIIMLNERIFEI